MQHRVLLWQSEMVPLTSKQFDLLCFFVKNPGRVLSKEELMQAVWPDSFVEEGSLTQTVFWLRKALAHGSVDTSANRRHILTIPGKGYQFNFLEPRPTTAYIVAPIEVLSTSPARSLPAAGSGRFVVWGILGATAVAMVLGTIRLYRAPKPEAVAAERPTQQEIVLGDFADSSKDQSLKTALATALRIGLEQSPRLSVVPEGEIAETLRYMKRSEPGTWTPALAEEVCKRRAAQALVLGSLSSVGEQYIVGIEARDCTSGKTLSAAKSTVQRKEQIVPAMDGMLPQLRAQLGESSTSIRQFSTSIEQATTPSLEAFQAFVAGDDQRQQANTMAAVSLYQQAISLDPNFAMAYARLGACYATLSEREQATAAFTKAYQLSGNISQPEKFYVQSFYIHRVERDMFDTIRADEEWRKLYPRNPYSWVGETDALTQMGRLGDAIRVGEEGYQRFPHNGMMVMAVSRAYQRSGRFDDLRRVAADAAKKGLDSWDLHEMLWYRASVLGDTAAADAEAAWVKGKPEEYQLLDDVAWLQLQQGRVRESLATWEHFEEAAKQQSMTGYADIDVGLYATTLVELGLRSDAVALLKRWPAVNVTPEYARGLAAIGDDPRAEAIMTTLVKDHLKDTLLVSWQKPILEATVALNHPGESSANKAIAILEGAKSVQMRDYGLSYLLGKAYLRVHRYAEAAAAFERIANSPGLDPTSPLRPLALQKIAQTSFFLHDTEGGEKAERSARFAWQHADQGFPPLAGFGVTPADRK